MASQFQIDADQRNAQVSTGPKALQGWCTSRMNALKHGPTREEDHHLW